MSASLLHSLFKYKAWANEELFAALEKMDPTTHEAERHTAIRILNHIYVVDRIFAAHLSGTAHTYTATNTPASVVSSACRTRGALLASAGRPFLVPHER